MNTPFPGKFLCVRVGTPPKDNGAYLQMFKTRENSQAHISNPQEKTGSGVCIGVNYSR